MPVTPGTTFWQQPALERERSADGATITVRYAGAWDDVAAYAATFAVGAAYPDDADYALSRVLLERYEGPSGRLTLTYSDSAASTDAQTAGGARVLSVSWSLVTTPSDVPIWRYCGPSAQNAKRYRVEPWMAEPDPALRADFKYRGPDGVVATLAANDIKLARKILLGFESVQRHYPTIRKVTRLSKGTVSPDGALDYIGAPSGAPESFTARAAAWLKTGEQIDIADDRTQTLTEEWIGGDSFDENFYGDDSVRWEWGTI